MSKKAQPKVSKPRSHTPAPQVLARMESLGLVIKAKRLQQGIRQQELIEKLGISTVSLQKVEAGQPGVAWGIVASITAALGLPFDVDALPEEELKALLSLAEERDRVR
jgi:transcriptional regulator with XRE-family HTH domain